MKTKLQILFAGLFLATLGTGLGQPCITITTQPTNQTPCFGTMATFTVGATGAEPLSYQWQQSFDGVTFTDRPDATNSTLEISNVQGIDTGSYRAIVTNVECVVTSAVATLFTVSSAPSISGQPTNWASVSLGANLTNRVIANGTLLSYQWRLNGAPLSGQTKSTILVTNIQVASTGQYDVVVANPCGSITSRTVNLDARAQTFTRVTNELCFAQTDAGTIVWFDYDNDGWADVLCAGGWDRGYGNRLFHNNRDGAFTQVSESNFPGKGDHTSWTTVADFNGDGLLDVAAGQAYTTTGSDLIHESPILYLNQGGGRFAETLLSSSVLGGIDVRAYTIAALDYNGDGFADLALGRVDVPTRGYLLRNTGESVFSVVTNSAWSLQAAVHETISSVDYNGDRRPDLWGAGASRSLPFTNAANGDFLLDTNSLLHNFQVGRTSINAAWGDYDNDGDLDVVINYANTAPTDLQLFLNDGSGGFTLGGFSAAVWSQYVYCADYDNDGLLDLYVTGFNSRSRLYRNLGGGTFTEVLNEPPAQDVFNQWPQAGWGDYDNDGFIDLLVVARGSSNKLYRNSPNGNQWLKIKLVGKASNRAAIGAVVRATASIGGQDVSQMRVVQAQSSITEMIAHFGLGDATNITTLRIEWPSGIVQELQNVATNQFLTVVESQGYTNSPPQIAGVAKVVDGFLLSITEPAAGARYIIEASTDLVTWTKLAARTSAGAIAQFTDTRATNYTQRFYRIQVP